MSWARRGRQICRERDERAAQILVNGVAAHMAVERGRESARRWHELTEGEPSQHNLAKLVELSGIMAAQLETIAEFVIDGAGPADG